MNDTFSAYKLFLKSHADTKFKPWDNVTNLTDAFMANRAFILDDADVLKVPIL